ncbi:MAG TPA: glycosyltransferase family 4 protein [Thermomicrobiales bacterium]|nr:glycosyltransferase family 4 protein [Thermomicrobiales bacterium]
MNKRILILTQWFEPEPVLKGMVFARALVERGYEVEVVTGFPNYPVGRLYPGYTMSLIKRERIDGVEVTRLPLYPSHDRSPIRRALTYLTFAASGGVYCLFFAKTPDVVYVYSLPTMGVVASVLKRLRGAPFIYDIQDVWPDSLQATGMMRSKPMVNAIAAVLRWVYRQAGAIVVQSGGFRRTLVERGVPESKVEVIHNWCDEVTLNRPSPANSVQFPVRDGFRILFAGNMGKAQGLDAVIDAAGLAQIRASHIQFVFVGAGLDVDRLKALARDRSLRNVVFLPRVEMDQVGALLADADALLVHLRPDPLFTITIPSKIQAYLAMGKPILIAVPGDATSLVREAGCGIEAASGDPESIASAAIQLASLRPAELADMGRRARDYYRTQLAIDVGVTKFVAAFERVAAAHA